MTEHQGVLPPNRLKAALRERRPQIGFWTALCSNVAAEILAGSGFDWILIDGEHAPNDLQNVLAQLQALTGGTAEPVVRVAWNDPVLIKRVLDLGARSLLVPFIQNAEEARRAVAATRFPPEGIRGVSTVPRANRYGRIRDYHRHASSEICVVLQVETRAALDGIEAIAAVDGVDGVFLGPSDIAADIGVLGEPAHPEVQRALAEACTRLTAIGRPAGTLTGDQALAARYFDLGYTFVAIGSDVAFLAQGSAKLATDMRQKLGAG